MIDGPIKSRNSIEGVILQDKAEPVYVLAGSKAESAAKRNPRKQVKIV